MKTLSTIATTFVLGLVSIHIYAADYNFKPGLWETTTTVEFEGVPANMAAMMKVPSQTEQECIKSTELMFESDKKCKFEQKRVSANKILVDVTCTESKAVIKGKGEVNFNGKTTSGWFEMEVSQGPAGPMKIKNKFKGKYLGPCK